MGGENHQFRIRYQTKLSLRILEEIKTFETNKELATNLPSVKEILKDYFRRMNCITIGRSGIFLKKGNEIEKCMNRSKQMSMT